MTIRPDFSFKSSTAPDHLIHPPKQAGRAGWIPRASTLWSHRTAVPLFILKESFHQCSRGSQEGKLTLLVENPVHICWELSQNNTPVVPTSTLDYSSLLILSTAHSGRCQPLCVNLLSLYHPRRWELLLSYLNRAWGGYVARVPQVVGRGHNASPGHLIPELTFWTMLHAVFRGAVDDSFHTWLYLRNPGA